MSSSKWHPFCLSRNVLNKLNDKKKKDFLKYLNNELVIQTVEAHLAKK